MRIFIGIDGGGTKTDYIACDEQGRVIKRVIGPETNPIDIGMEQALKILIQGIDKLTDKKNIFDSLYVGLSGGTTGNSKQGIYEGLRRYFKQPVIIDNGTDALNPLIYELGREDGCVVIAGTGTVGFSRKGKEIIQVGGYGYLLDKGGSGYDYGRDALYSALSSLDRRGEHTVVARLLEDSVGSIREHISTIYEKGKKYIASFAPIVFEAYQMNDPKAIQIVDQNSRELAKIFNALAEYQGTNICKTVLAGSIFKDFSIIYPHLKHYLEHEFSFIPLTVSPVCGAVIQAAINAGEIDIPSYKSNIAASIVNYVPDILI